MNRRSLLWLALAGLVAFALFHARGPARTPPREASRPMSYRQLKQAIRNGTAVPPVSPAKAPAQTREAALDSLEPAKVVALDDPTLLLVTVRRIWNAEAQKQPVPEEAEIVSRAADAVILTDAFVPFDSKSLIGSQQGWNSLLSEPRERIVAIERALRRIGDETLLKTLASIAGPPGKKAHAGAKGLGQYTLPQWNRLLSTLRSAELEARLVAFVRAHPASTILPPTQIPRHSWTDEKDWKQTAIEHVSAERWAEEAEAEARLDALPMAQLVKKSDHDVLWSVERRVRARRREVGLEGLTPLERATDLLTTLVGEVANGGFDQYFFNSSGDYALEAMDSLRFVHADKAAKVFARALAAFPGSAPSKNFVQRQDQIDQINKAHPRAWDALDREFWAAPSDEIQVKLVEAIRAAPDQIERTGSAPPR